MKTLIKLFLIAVIFMPALALADMIEVGKLVRFHYTLTVEDEIIETSQGLDPLEYEHGQSLIIPGLERQLEGLEVGDTKTIIVAPEEGYGPVLQEGFKEVPKDRMPDDGPELQPGLVLEMQTPDGNSIPTIIHEVNEDTVTLNFNHPLAGKELQFDVEVVSVE